MPCLLERSYDLLYIGRTLILRMLNSLPRLIPLILLSCAPEYGGNVGINGRF
jgi:hypothetical protein